MKKDIPLIYQLLAEVLIAAIIISSTIFVFLPRPAKAAQLAFEVNPIMTIFALMDKLKEYVGDSLVWAVTSSILNNLAIQTVNWVRTGAKPAFVQNWRGFLTGAMQEGLLRFNSYFGATALPLTIPRYRPGLNRLLTADITNPLIANFNQRFTNTFSSHGVNPGMIDAFPQDFEAGGGWRTFEAMLQPNNNFYSLYFTSLGAQANTAGLSVKSGEDNAVAGGGFVGKENALTGEIETPGSTVRDVLKSTSLEGPSNKLANADEIMELLVALLSDAFNNILSKGLAPSGGSSVLSAPIIPSPEVPPPTAPTTPTISISANPSSITEGGSSTISWNATNADLCLGSGSWAEGEKPVSGSQSVSPSVGTHTYTLTCYNAAGKTSRSATLTVNPYSYGPYSPYGPYGPYGP